MINRAKAWKSATKTQVIESQQTEEQVNYTAYSAASYNSKFNPNLAQNKTRSGSVQNKRNIPCVHCGGSVSHPRKSCPAAKLGVLCRNCYVRNHFASVCPSLKDKFKHNCKKQVNGLEIDDG